MQGYRRMRVSARVQYQDVCCLRSLLDPIDQLAFRIGLAKGDFGAFRRVLHLLMNIAKRFAAINVRLSGAEQVEIRTIQDKNVLRHCHTVLRWNAREGKSVINNGGYELQIFLNGEPRVVEEGTTILALVTSLAGDPRGIAIERNLEIVPKSEHETTRLCDGDRLEVVQFVGGG